MDVRALAYDDATFDTVVTSCVFCSVPDPVTGLRELHRCLKPGGRLLMFEHVRSRLGVVALMQHLLTPFTSRYGPDLNRDTTANALRAGFVIAREDNVYLDVVRAVEAAKVDSRTPRFISTAVGTPSAWETPRHCNGRRHEA
jgi:ubiquinone/menaquinone biosynthesis C-methylase UbiE